ncbi:Dam family site-specific DNA-(adenine-N6)-methyltransferase [Lysinibacillus sphaericus]|nr:MULTISPECIES: Dam family site-specific DNA-(adenine-N6)-methyltransferase [Lysinibacillus]MBE5084383.1 Dam family site-specific DNA-(adenine-N6)-methyltransferase [Bacillus thuringiensis]AMO32285.1 DNA methyltransferase [Lysinibacillus sphaericus]AMR92616.1 DNA methyltransferase [Lysinibacillus sphaericus]ANA46665.1 DNA methyltransferase [Lysinibacillus sphaericus]KZL46078.1 DNA methyltransferase [Lysinibacillus sphaericus]
MSNKEILPFLTWAGGKRWLVNNYPEIFPSDFNVYIEPFLGSGSVFFHLKPQKAILSDINEDLINTYIALKTDWQNVYKHLKIHQRKHSPDYYYKIRDYTPRKLETKAARFLYLNRTCFNGIYRVNKQGKFNVPIGSKQNVILNTDDFKEISDRLKSVLILNHDYEAIINMATRDDFIFVDPPYTVNHNDNGFIQYNEKLFSWADQVRLCEALGRARDRGAKIIVTNANHESVRNLYEGHGFEYQIVSRFSGISSKAKGRKKYEEIIVKSNF